MKIIKIDEKLKSIFKVLKNVYATDKINFNPAIRSIYWDAKSKTFNSTNGKSLMVFHINDEQFEKELGSSCLFDYKDGIILEQKMPPKHSYSSISRIIDNFQDKQYETVDLTIPSCVKKKYRHAIIPSILTYHTQRIFSPEFFEMVKDICDDLTSLTFSKDGKYNFAKAILLSNRSESIQYVVMPINLDK